MTATSSPGESGVFRPEPFKAITEPWTEIEMKDVHVRVRFTPSLVGRMYESDGVTPQVNSTGEPVIQVQGQLTIVVWPQPTEH